eukprot:CAMPEP_0172448270 /NCGR_PEP_ID=MMETSP1065-20121228/7313_1 /TAXON_ID=265537 /ORGANISM="Amphiprora paludosa, Strain CCMP125" /LENGTH=315 /DNA_ID=CAMNT_0013199713 /DNA_START=58 /DNA_END=1002 /DNA_ORIENTATION=-
MPLLSISSPETMQAAATMFLQSTDVFIASYPKSGTTWTQHIVLSLLMREQRNDPTRSTEKAPNMYQHVSDYAPFLDIDAHWELPKDNNHDAPPQLVSWIRDNHTTLGRRVFNTHLRFDMLPSGAAAKIIYVVRSPLDVCVSFFYHLSHQVEGRYEQDLNVFFEEWLKGELPFGSWIDHVMSYAAGVSNATTNDHNNNSAITTTTILNDGRQVLWISYEDMVDNLEAVVQDMAQFLNLQYVTYQEITQELLPTFTFAAMRQDLSRFQPQSVTWKDNFSFLRKGIKGDARQALSETQRAQFVQRLEEARVGETLDQW